MKLISTYVYGLFGPARHAVLVGPFGPARHENRPMGRAWAVGQARSPGQPGTVARRAGPGPARARAGPGRAARLLMYKSHTEGEVVAGMHGRWSVSVQLHTGKSRAGERKDGRSWRDARAPERSRESAKSLTSTTLDHDRYREIEKLFVR